MAQSAHLTAICFSAQETGFVGSSLYFLQAMLIYGIFPDFRNESPGNLLFLVTLGAMI